MDRETIYRYIRQGKLIASRLGRSYRVPRRSLDLLLWAIRTRPDITDKQRRPPFQALTPRAFIKETLIHLLDYGTVR